MTTYPADIKQAASDAIFSFTADGNFSPDQMMDAFCATIMKERERSAGIAEMFIINENSIHPDVPFEKMAEHVKMIAHTTCQHIASAIRNEGEQKT